MPQVCQLLRRAIPSRVIWLVRCPIASLPRRTKHYMSISPNGTVRLSERYRVPMLRFPLGVNFHRYRIVPNVRCYWEPTFVVTSFAGKPRRLVTLLDYSAQRSTCPECERSRPETESFRWGCFRPIAGLVRAWASNDRCHRRARGPCRHCADRVGAEPPAQDRTRACWLLHPLNAT